MTEIFANGLGQYTMQKNPLKTKCDQLLLLLSSAPQKQMEASSVTVFWLIGAEGVSM